MTYAALQRALRGRGHDPGPIDGVPGRRTTAAIRAFQAASGLAPTGFADAATLARLLPGAGPSPPPWLAVAAALEGVAERPGEASNPTILGWARPLPAWVARFYAEDTIPWCGLFVAHAMATALPEEPLPANPLSALAWGGFGRALAKPSPGAVLVFRRPGGGHVGLYLGERADAFRVLGGNQADRVGEAWIAKRRHVATRWPLTSPPPTAGPLILAGSGRLSTNES